MLLSGPGQFRPNSRSQKLRRGGGGGCGLGNDRCFQHRHQFRAAWLLQEARVVQVAGHLAHVQPLGHCRQRAALQQYPQRLWALQTDCLEHGGAAATGFDLVGALWRILQQVAQCVRIIAFHRRYQSCQCFGFFGRKTVAIGLVGDLALVAPITALDAQEIGDQSDRNAGGIQRPVARIDAVAPAAGEYDQAMR